MLNCMQFRSALETVFRHKGEEGAHLLRNEFGRGVEGRGVEVRGVARGCCERFSALHESCQRSPRAGSCSGTYGGCGASVAH